MDQHRMFIISFNSHKQLYEVYSITLILWTRRLKEVTRLAEVYNNWQISDVQCHLFNTQACGLSISPLSL